MTEQILRLQLQEICEELDVSRDACIELVELGLIQPAGEGPDEWIFDTAGVTLVRRTLRLQRDLDLDWTAAALMVDLLEERDRLRAELAAMEQRLQRFLAD